MGRAAVADDDLWVGDALLPRPGTAELQPGRPQRVKVGVFGYARETINPRGLRRDNKCPIIDKPVQIQT